MYEMNPRKTALEVLCEIEGQGAYSNLTLQGVFERNKMEPSDRKLITRLVYGVLENRILIDYNIQKYSKSPMNKMKPWVRNALRIALYQMGWMDRIPDSAAINESVKLVKKRYMQLGSFTNGVLRSIQRSGIDHGDQLPEGVQKLSLQYSHPLWMVERWSQQFGMEKAIEILKANNQPAELTVRVNLLKISVPEALQQLQRQGVSVKASELIPEALILEDLGAHRLIDLTLFQNGSLTVQDISSMLVARGIDPQPGQRVLDLCGAPGGKTTHIAERMGDAGAIIACDIHPHKLDLILANAARLGLKSIETIQQDGTVYREDWAGTFDHVLVDAPCSGLGIIRRKPEIRHTKSLEDSRALAVLQANLLETASRYVKKHGQLIYSTCTIECEENQQVVESFLAKHPSFKLVDLNRKVGLNSESESPYVALLPGQSGLDGFFIAGMVRSEEVE